VSGGVIGSDVAGRDDLASGSGFPILLASVSRRLAGNVVLALALIVASAGAAWAAGSQVVLLRAAEKDPPGRQAETLLGAELRAAGFSVVERARSAVDPRADIERVSTALDPIATLALVFAPGKPAADIWLLDRVTGKLVIRSIDVGGGDAADIALRAVELLRGSLLEIALEPRRSRASASPAAARPPPSEVSRFVAETAPWRRVHFLHGFGVGLGAAALGLLPDNGVSFAPAARLSFGGPGGLGLRLSAVGLGSAVSFESRDRDVLLGRATLRRDVVLLDGFWVFRRGAILQPFASAGTGVSRLRVEGKGSGPMFPDLGGTKLAAVVSAGAGLAVRMGGRAALVVEAQMLALLPRTRVLIADQTAATVGGPSALVSGGLVTAF
jgi:hypothetical protein